MSKKVEQTKEYEESLPTYALSRPDDAVRRMMGMYGFKRVSLKEADIVVFPGGADIHPILYGQPCLKITHPSLRADQEDILALRSTNHKQWKVGICRGAQFLNVMLGNGSMYQHVQNHNLGYHPAVEPGANGRMINVSSVHHQMMIPGSTGIPLLTTCISADLHTPEGVFKTNPLPCEDVEALIYVDEKAFCYQPHPEISHAGNRECRQWFFDQIETYILTTSQARALEARRKAIGD